ncbi:MAG: nucleotide sugar dehydrogenase [Candidatus Vogelbacteria bacterium]|nr:nucleotide sugar dehydrogenase [Candidatus Vogelbacteria bacterium]
MSPKTHKKYDICVIGGAGHIGLPLGITFANSGFKTTLLDINKEGLQKIKDGKMPFKEESGEKELKKALLSKKLSTSTSPEVICDCDIIVVVIGTPVDEYLNPDFRGIIRLVDTYIPHFKDGQTLILRSTVLPGTSEKIQNYLYQKGKKISVAFCPERIIQGKALIELKEAPQIISAFSETTLKKVEKIFKKITKKKIIKLKPIEAELAKLYSNAWRYISFAVANQFYMISKDHDLDYVKIHEAMTEDYPRNNGLPMPGFAAGPCLFKDTMQLSAFAHNNFFLGHSAMLINEGLPAFIVNKLKQKHNLRDKKIGILGMAFKANNDDPRDSLAYKLKKIAHTECKEVFCHDIYIKDQDFHSLEKVLEKSDIIILATPHNEYKRIDPKKYPKKTFIDIWSFWN